MQNRNICEYPHNQVSNSEVSIFCFFIRVVQFGQKVSLRNQLDLWLRSMPKSFDSNRTFALNLLFSASDDNETILAEKWQFEISMKTLPEIQQKMRQTQANNPYLQSEESLISQLVSQTEGHLPGILGRVAKCECPLS